MPFVSPASCRRPAETRPLFPETPLPSPLFRVVEARPRMPSGRSRCQPAGKHSVGRIKAVVEAQIRLYDFATGRQRWAVSEVDFSKVQKWLQWRLLKSTSGSCPQSSVVRLTYDRRRRISANTILRFYDLSRLQWVCCGRLSRRRFCRSLRQNCTGLGCSQRNAIIRPIEN